jgi:hypothetical protein
VERTYLQREKSSIKPPRKPFACLEFLLRRIQHGTLLGDLFVDGS